jgi:hypothetical protein
VRYAGAERRVRCWRGDFFSPRDAVPDAFQPEEAVSVPIRAGDRLGHLRKAAVDAAIPSVPLVEDHDALDTAVPFAHDESSRLEPDALARCRSAGGRSLSGLEGFALHLAQAAQDRPIEISECRRLDAIGEHGRQEPSRKMGGRDPA